MFKKLTDKLQKNPKLKKLMAGTFAVVMCMTMLAPAAFATDGTSISPSDAATQVLGHLQGDISLGTILSVIGIGISACIGIYLGVWAIRKVALMLFGVFTRGRIRF